MILKLWTLTQRVLVDKTVLVFIVNLIQPWITWEEPQ